MLAFDTYKHGQTLYLSLSGDRRGRRGAFSLTERAFKGAGAQSLLG